jgi:hypothetical protein
MLQKFLWLRKIAISSYFTRLVWRTNKFSIYSPLLPALGVGRLGRLNRKQGALPQHLCFSHTLEEND